MCRPLSPEESFIRNSSILQIRKLRVREVRCLNQVHHPVKTAHFQVGFVSKDRSPESFLQGLLSFFKEKIKIRTDFSGFLVQEKVLLEVTYLCLETPLLPLLIPFQLGSFERYIAIAVIQSLWLPGPWNFIPQLGCRFVTPLKIMICAQLEFL